MGAEGFEPGTSTFADKKPDWNREFVSLRTATYSHRQVTLGSPGDKPFMDVASRS